MGMEGSGRIREGLEGPRGPKRVVGGSGGGWRVLEDLGVLEDQRGYKRIYKDQDRSRWVREDPYGYMKCLRV